jgi:type IV fimbrial biogenesis protein FimT
MKGFTLMELLITVTIVGILVAIGVPSLRDLILKNRLRGAAEEAQTMLQFARSEAVKRNEDVYVNFMVGPPWCFGASVSSNCNCSNASGCVLAIAGTNVSKQVSGVDYRGVTLGVALNGGGNEIQYDRRRGLTTKNGTLTFTNGRYEIQVVINNLGRVRMCSPSDAGKKVLGYDDCPP